MATRTTRAGGRRGRRPTRSTGRTAAAVRSAVERAVDRVLSSDEAFTLMVRRLEEAGWRIERDPGASTGGESTDVATLTPPARAR